MESEATASSDDEPRAPTQETEDSLKWWWVTCEEEQEMEEGQKVWKAYRRCMVRDWRPTHVTAPAGTVRLTTEGQKTYSFGYRNTGIA